MTLDTVAAAVVTSLCHRRIVDRICVSCFLVTSTEKNEYLKYYDIKLAEAIHSKINTGHCETDYVEEV